MPFVKDIKDIVNLCYSGCVSGCRVPIVRLCGVEHLDGVSYTGSTPALGAG